MTTESVDAKLARLDEKFEHLIRTHEDANRERREAHKALNSRLDDVDDRMKRVENAVLAANVTWKTVVKISSFISIIVGVLYAIVHNLGLSFTIK